MNPTLLQTLLRNLVRRRSNHGFLSLLIQPHFNSSSFNHTHFFISTNSIGLKPFVTNQFSSSFSSKTIRGNNSDDFDKDEFDQTISDDDNYNGEEVGVKDEFFIRDVEIVMRILLDFRSNCKEARDKLEQCGVVVVTSNLVGEVLSRVRNDWEAAFTFFVWAGKQTGYSHSLRAYHSMIAILGKMRKFDTAWSLIREMKSLVTPQTLVIMMRKYCAVHDVGKAMSTFYALKRFKFEIGIEEFHGLLSALCRYKNVENAEQLLICNENTFPLDTKSFNIVLNGWCNVLANLRESNRFWRDMARRGIKRDVISYSSIISCYSKARRINDVLKLFSEMKESGITPDRKVYNAVIYALAKGMLFKEAINLMKNMEENSVVPNAVTYNSLIKGLCRNRRTNEARIHFDAMLQRGLYPSIHTCHILFGCLSSGEHVFELLESMKKNACCHPTNDTYVLLIKKFCEWRQHENVFKLWSKIVEDGLSPDRSSYTAMAHGLFWNGKVEEGFKYYKEMKEKGFLPERKTDEIFQAWLSGRKTEELCTLEQKNDKLDSGLSRKKKTNRFGRDLSQ
ncbi:hypothetical protein GIB67_006723 [Kingdonia uniflora]|uniref:Pentatricopeptide repeat-containing protein n=1 Tax=Kingdonia uniflora TaxID=39325 RepID=A0A7J7LYX6_9MAGN|nr:hypothetical protein GIB67_006723 [Kingdonia uniflora]